MKKRIISIMLVIAMFVTMFAIPTNALSVKTISLQDARNIATYYFSNLSLNDDDDFTLSGATPLYNNKDEMRFYCFDYAFSDGETGYIVVSIRSDLPYVMEQGVGSNPYCADNIKKVYYIGPMNFFLVTNDGDILDFNGDKVTTDAVNASFDEYEDYRNDLLKSNSGIIEDITDENSSMVRTLNKIKLKGLLKNFTKENLIAYVEDICDYWIGSKSREKDFDKVNSALEQIVRDDAGDGYYVCESGVVDKTYMVPKRQGYYETNVGNGICGKASFMMSLAYYRDAGICPKLPDDETMYSELCKIFNDIDDYFQIFFKNDTVNSKLGIRSSFEILGTLDMGIAYYLYSYGYRDLAQNVIDNMRFSVTMVPNGISEFLLTLVRNIFNVWLRDRTNSELKLTTNKKINPADVIRQSLLKKEPVVIGCLASIGCDTYSNHYFAGVGYYKMKTERTIFGFNTLPEYKEYVEVYDTWGEYSAVISFTVLKATALYSVNSLAKL